MNAFFIFCHFFINTYCYNRQEKEKETTTYHADFLRLLITGTDFLPQKTADYQVKNRKDEDKKHAFIGRMFDCLQRYPLSRIQAGKCIDFDKLWFVSCIHTTHAAFAVLLHILFDYLYRCTSAISILDDPFFNNHFFFKHNWANTS